MSHQYITGKAKTVVDWNKSINVSTYSNDDIITQSNCQDEINQIIKKEIDKFHEKHNKDIYPDTTGDLSKIVVDWNKSINDSPYDDNYLAKKYSKRYFKQVPTEVKIDLPSTIGDKLKSDIDHRYDMYVNNMVEEITKFINYQFNKEISQSNNNDKIMEIIITKTKYENFVYETTSYNKFQRTKMYEDYDNFIHENFNLLYKRCLKFGFYIIKQSHPFDNVLGFNGNIIVSLKPRLKDKINIIILKMRRKW